MYSYYHDFTGIRTRYESEIELNLDIMVPFRTEALDDLTTSVVIRRGIPARDWGANIYRERMYAWYRTDSGKFWCVINYSDTNTAERVAILTDPEWKNVEAYFATDEDAKKMMIKSVGEIIHRNAVIRGGGMTFHAVGIRHEGRGIFFSAPSETGKTTHANLWVEHKGAVIINGDRPAVMLKDGVFNLCGSPWSGSTPVFENSFVPLSSIVFLQRGTKNEIRKLLPVEASIYATQRAFLPYFDKSAMQFALGNVDKIITTVNCYLLKCLPDKEAMELVAQCVMD